jgi:hypothetical protein
MSTLPPTQRRFRPHRLAAATRSPAFASAFIRQATSFTDDLAPLVATSLNDKPRLDAAASRAAARGTHARRRERRRNTGIQASPGSPLFEDVDALIASAGRRGHP